MSPSRRARTTRAAWSKGAIGASVFALALAPPSLAQQRATEPPVAVSASAFLLVSGVDGSALAAKRPAARRPIASITKLMTVLVALEHADLDDWVVVTRAATSVHESSAGLLPGERLSVRELVSAALVPSANDAATALALHVGHGSIDSFVELMNRKAAALGMRDTHFANPHGLDERGHLSSARDVVKLLRAAMREPIVRRMGKLHEVTIAGRRLESTDDLLGRLDGLVAAKTGHTSAAGWSQVAAVRRNGVLVLGAVLGAPTREQRNDDLSALVERGLDEYGHVTAVVRGQSYAVVPTGWGRTDLTLVSTRTVVAPARVGHRLVQVVEAPARLVLPVRAGQRLGTLRVLDGGRLVASEPLVASRGIDPPGRVERARYYTDRALHHLYELVS